MCSSVCGRRCSPWLPFTGSARERIRRGWLRELVAGIGFIGAGAIIRTGEGILAGLTTASSIWAVAAIVMCAGAGLYILAPVAGLVVFIVLTVPRKTSKE